MLVNGLDIPKFPLSVGDLNPIQYNIVPWAHVGQHLKLPLDQLSHFCSAHERDQ